MADNVFSFSTKTVEERELILKLKKECRQQGVSFSWLVTQALKNYAKPAVR